jgi:alpha-N-acetylglucosamine transferase
MVLGHSLRDNGTNKQLAALVTLDSLQASTISELEVYMAFYTCKIMAKQCLQKVYDQIIPVDRIVNKNPANLFLMNRPDLISTFTKIALWRQTQFSRLVYIDADVVALRAPDELFNDKSDFAAVPDIGWPDCFNSGVLALTPNMGDYYALLALAQRGISFDGADQGLLNMHFRDWHRLSFTYNCTPSGNYQYVPAYRHFQSTINMVHYIGDNKPWVVGRESKGATGVYEELLGRWWAVYDKHYRYPACHPQLYVTGVSADSKESQAYSSEQSEQEARNVREYVKGETSCPVGLSAGPSVGHEERTEASITTTEPQLTEKTEPAEDLERGDANRLPTAQQRRFSVAWDPIQSVIYDWIVEPS